MLGQDSDSGKCGSKSETRLAFSVLKDKYEPLDISLGIDGNSRMMWRRVIEIRNHIRLHRHPTYGRYISSVSLYEESVDIISFMECDLTL